MRYDPILCMNVPDSKKAKDDGLKVTSYVINKGQSGEYYGLKNKETNQVLYSAPNNWKSREGAKRWAEKKGMTYVEDSDEKSLDKAIRSCDEEQVGMVKRSGYGIELHYQGGGKYAVVDLRQRPAMILRTGPKAVMESEYTYIVSQVKAGKM